MLLNWTEVLQEVAKQGELVSLGIIAIAFLVFSLIKLRYQKHMVMNILSHKNILSKLAGLVFGVGSMFGAVAFLESVAAFFIAAIVNLLVLPICFLFIMLQNSDIRSAPVESMPLSGPLDEKESENRPRL